VPVAAGVFLGLGAVLWAFGTVLEEAAQRWIHDPQYSHGFFVPAFAVVLLGLRRRHLELSAWAPSWWGLLLLVAGCGLFLAGTHYCSDWVEAIALLPCLAGVFLACGGRMALGWAWPPVLFLFFMIPLPYRAAVALAGPLQRLATVASTFVLQTLGLPAVAEGNVILLNDVEIGIVEACSGLRMLMVFFALATGVALVSRRPVWDRIAIVASALPIALFVNLVRITATGVLHGMDKSELANTFFHDLAGWLMMPLALALLGLELKILSWLLIEKAQAGPVRLGLASAGTIPVRSRDDWKAQRVKT
jgi:exosortase